MTKQSAICTMCESIIENPLCIECMEEGNIWEERAFPIKKMRSKCMICGNIVTMCPLCYFGKTREDEMLMRMSVE